MIVINQKSIQAKIKKFVDSEEFSDAIIGYTKREAEERAKYLANCMKDLLYGTAYGMGVPASVISHIDSMASSDVVFDVDNPGATIRLSFSEDTRRNSLRTRSGYTGDGVYDIVGLFDKGYTARSEVFGFWEKSNGEEEYVVSRQSRKGLGFIKRAVDMFNITYGTIYDCVATVDG